MSEQLITACTKCNAKFHLTEKQLNKSSGKVRCSKCYNVFDANRRLKRINTSANVAAKRLQNVKQQTIIDDIKSKNQLNKSKKIEVKDREKVKTKARKYKMPDEFAFSSYKIDKEQFKNLDDESAFFYDVEASFWSKYALTAFLSLLACLLMFMQFTVYNFDKLSTKDEWRGFLAIVCATKICQLPQQSDFSKIQVSNLIVRQDIKDNSKLVADAILLNNADFDQNFPILEIEFSDIYGSLVQSVSLKADDYLSGELAGENIMPKHIPVHISFSVDNPGNVAVNYQLNLINKQ